VQRRGPPRPVHARNGEAVTRKPCRENIICQFGPRSDRSGHGVTSLP
jgi:hypothetical protein